MSRNSIEWHFHACDFQSFNSLSIVSLMTLNVTAFVASMALQTFFLKKSCREKGAKAQKQSSALILRQMKASFFSWTHQKMFQTDSWKLLPLGNSPPEIQMNIYSLNGSISKDSMQGSFEFHGTDLETCPKNILHHLFYDWYVWLFAVESHFQFQIFSIQRTKVYWRACDRQNCQSVLNIDSISIPTTVTIAFLLSAASKTLPFLRCGWGND